MNWFDKVIIQGITYFAHDNEIQSLKTAENINKLLRVNNGNTAIETIDPLSLPTPTATQTALEQKMDKTMKVITVELGDE